MDDDYTFKLEQRDGTPAEPSVRRHCQATASRIHSVAMTRLSAASLVGSLVLLLAGTSIASAHPAAPTGSVWTNILGLGSDGVISRHDMVALRQMKMDRIAIAAIVRQTRDGGRLTKAEMTTIAKAFIRRHNPICRRANPPRWACAVLYDAPTKKKG